MYTMLTQKFQTAQATFKPMSPLKYQRLLRGWSQLELAKRISDLCLHNDHKYVHVNINLISRWEQGKNQPTLLYRKQLCEIFGMNAQQLGFLHDRSHASQLPDNHPPSQDAAL